MEEQLKKCVCVCVRDTDADFCKYNIEQLIALNVSQFSSG
jgi:hypothetical protein